MRDINEIIIHCSATKPSQYAVNVDLIRQWHLARNWTDIGYHYVITRDAAVEKGRSLEIAGAHAYGRNKHSIGICLVGGLSEANIPEFNFTAKQMHAMRDLLQQIGEDHGRMNIIGHRDVPGVNKACPCFDVKEWFS